MDGLVIGRGVRLGLAIGAWPAGIFGSLMLVGAAMWLRSEPQRALDVLLRGIAVAGGSLGVGVLLGAATGAALALAPGRLAARAPLRGLLAGCVAGTVYLGETLVVAVGTDVGYGPTLLAFLSTPVAAAVAAAHSGDVLGHTHYHPWLSGERPPTGWPRRLRRILASRGDR